MDVLVDWWSSDYSLVLVFIKTTFCALCLKNKRRCCFNWSHRLILIILIRYKGIKSNYEIRNDSDNYNNYLLHRSLREDVVGGILCLVFYFRLRFRCLRMLCWKLNACDVNNCAEAIFLLISICSHYTPTDVKDASLYNDNLTFENDVLVRKDAFCHSLYLCLSLSVCLPLALSLSFQFLCHWTTYQPVCRCVKLGNNALWVLVHQTHLCTVVRACVQLSAYLCMMCIIECIIIFACV